MVSAFFWIRLAGMAMASETVGVYEPIRGSVKLLYPVST